MKLQLRTVIRVGGLIMSLCAAGLVCAALVWLTLRVENTVPTDQNRAEERLKILTNATAASQQILDNYAWQDTEKGFVRLPIERAKELTIEEWKNPNAARSKLMERAAVLLAVPPAITNSFQ